MALHTGLTSVRCCPVCVSKSIAGGHGFWVRLSQLAEAMLIVIVIVIAIVVVVIAIVIAVVTVTVTDTNTITVAIAITITTTLIITTTTTTTTIITVITTIIIIIVVVIIIIIRSHFFWLEQLRVKHASTRRLVIRYRRPGQDVAYAASRAAWRAGARGAPG